MELDPDDSVLRVLLLYSLLQPITEGWTALTPELKEELERLLKECLALDFNEPGCHQSGGHFYMLTGDRDGMGVLARRHGCGALRRPSLRRGR